MIIRSAAKKAMEGPRKKRTLRQTALTICFLGIAAQNSVLAAKIPYRVVLDPGHGGQDLGASYGHGSDRIHEKDITLAIAQEVAQELKRRKIQAVLTRNRDQAVDLADRTALANRIQADLFISIHMNSAGSVGAQAEGIETFILNSSSDASSKRLADLENKVLEGSAADQQNLSDVNLILKDLMLSANQEESARLACEIQDSLAANGRRNRGVKQALFYVLLGADMPSVLLETGFLDHEKDRQMVRSPQGRREIARKIALAIENFRNNLGKKATVKALSHCKIN